MSVAIKRILISPTDLQAFCTKRKAESPRSWKGRGILAQRGESVTIDADGEKAKQRFGDATKLGAGIHPGKWNDFRVVAKGNHLQHFINETMTSELIDQQTEKAATDGVIALQIHRGPAMVVRFKNIKIRKLK